jgi:hypothetical protein
MCRREARHWSCPRPQWARLRSRPGTARRGPRTAAHVTSDGSRHARSGVTVAARPPTSRSRKTLIYLILTLNHIYPDYDFSQLRAHHFQKEDTVNKAEEAIDSHLLEVSKVGGWSGAACVRAHSTPLREGLQSMPHGHVTGRGACGSCVSVRLTWGCPAWRARQVWAKTPGFGETPFLECLWSSVDEVRARVAGCGS